MIGLVLRTSYRFVIWFWPIAQTMIENLLQQFSMIRGQVAGEGNIESLIGCLYQSHLNRPQKHLDNPLFLYENTLENALQASVGPTYRVRKFGRLWVLFTKEIVISDHKENLKG